MLVVISGLVLAGVAGLAQALNSGFQSVTFQRYVSTGAQQTVGTGWQAVPGLTLPIPITHGPVTVSAQMTKGAAQFRVITVVKGSLHEADPGAVTYTSRAANAFTFYNAQDCVPVVVQWRRVGTSQARFAVATAHALWGSGCG